jgi:hypothetical protein
MSYKIKNKNVQKLTHYRPVGNIIPHAWWTHPLLQRSGKPYYQAIILLADIVYWFRPVEERDEITGQSVGVKQRFASDSLSRSRRHFAELYGLSKKEVSSALKQLQDAGLILCTLRTLICHGTRLNNALHIDLNAEKIIEISTPISSPGDRGSVPAGREPDAQRGETNTKISIEIKNNNNTAGQSRPVRRDASCSVKAVVVSNPSEEVIVELLARIPESERSVRLRKSIAAVLQSGQSPDVIRSNIVYAIKHHVSIGRDGKQQALGGLIVEAIRSDYAKSSREKAAEENKARAERDEMESAQQEAQTAEEAAEKAKRAEQLAAWRALPEETRNQLESLAYDRWSLLRDLRPNLLEKALAWRYADGSLS